MTTSEDATPTSSSSKPPSRHIREMVAGVTSAALSKTAVVLHRSLESVPVYAKEMVAGGVSGVVSKTAVAPLDRAKIILQARTPAAVPTSPGALRSLQTIWRQEGVVGLYRGNGAATLRVFPYASLRLMTYERYRCWLLHHGGDSLGSGPLVDLLAASASSGTALLCTYPLDLARSRLACLPGPTGGGTFNVLRGVYSEAGVRGLYRGACPTLMRVLPNVGLRFYAYEELKNRVPEGYKGCLAAKLSCGVAAGAAGLLAQTATYPLDVVRRRMQTQQGGAITGTLQGVVSIARTQGWRQLYAGLGVSYVKAVPSVAIGLTTFDAMKALLKLPPREKKKG